MIRCSAAAAPSAAASTAPAINLRFMAAPYTARPCRTLAYMPGIEDPDKIDVIAEGADGNALLSIVQTGPWPTDGSERNRLKRKLGTYLRYAQDGQMVATYPTLEGRPVVIELTYEVAPPQSVVDYWRRRSQTAARDGVTLSMRALDDIVWRA
ncbi:MAG: hypothetical protein QOG42_539 [Solirubrobacteraceae bacterium]|nr:hypothetical protein [Solirubrobacteraceae bacterium]